MNIVRFTEHMGSDHNSAQYCKSDFLAPSFCSATFADQTLTTKRTIDTYKLLQKDLKDPLSG